LRKLRNRCGIVLTTPLSGADAQARLSAVQTSGYTSPQ
jgi:hypothetical protein